MKSSAAVGSITLAAAGTDAAKARFFRNVRSGNIIAKFESEVIAGPENRG